MSVIESPDSPKGLEKEGGDKEPVVNDGVVIARVLGGETDAFEILLRRYEAYVMAITSRHVPYDSCREVAHEAFIKIYTSLASYRGLASNGGKNSFKGWCARIVVRTCYDYWRRQYKNGEVPMSSLTEEHEEWLDRVVSYESSAEHLREHSKREALEVLSGTLASLSPEDRMVVTLLHLEGHSVKETAELLGWTTISVKVRAHRARHRLRERIQKLLS
ncbi:MAG: RNA polymerase sigma factor [Nitrospirae bacterium]|nr:RNA polymerase sigma factor [Nitrospirota bacterium]